MLLANQTAWFQQNKDFTATPLLKPNAWVKHNIRTICTKPAPTKVNEKSTSTLNITSSNREELDTLQQILSKLQSVEVENKKMRDSFATNRAEKRQNTVQAKSDINLLKEVNQRLVQNTTDLQQQYITSYLYFRNRRLQPKLVGAPLYLHKVAASPKGHGRLFNSTVLI